MNSKSDATKAQRIKLVSKWFNELERICKEECDGNWDKMQKRYPNAHDGLPINWSEVAKAAGIKTTNAGVAALIRSCARNEEILEAV